MHVNQQASADSTFPVQKYEITYQSNSGGNHSIALDCNSQLCRYNYSVNEATSSTYEVSIGATNVVGRSPLRDCSTQPIGKDYAFSVCVGSNSLYIIRNASRCKDSRIGNKVDWMIA